MRSNLEKVKQIWLDAYKAEIDEKLAAIVTAKLNVAADIQGISLKLGKRNEDNHMVQPIIKDENFLCLPSSPATIADLPVARDLQDTLTANADRCVGLAANMIGVPKRIIVVDDDGTQIVLLNPEIIKSSEPFDTEEACLSLEGTRPCRRYKSIKVQYQNSEFQTRLKTFKGFTAQIIQHEVDHCNGIII